MALPHSVPDIAPAAGRPAALNATDLTAGAAQHPLLIRARAAATAEGRPYAGNVTPQEAMELASAGLARIVDVRTPEERKFVGYVPDSLPVAWMTGTALVRNPRFVRELEGKTRKDEVLLFLCRSGQRSAAAAEAATRAQFLNAFNVVEGFEGDLDDRKRRGTTNGWRFYGLPWIQD